MDIPEYIIKAAKEYSSGNDALFDAFIAGFKATRQPKAKHITLTCEQQSLFEQSWKCYGMKGNMAKAKKVWAGIPITSLPVILSHIKAYVGSREKKYTKDFERYLNDKEYHKIVFDGSRVVFDPRQFDIASEYRPMTDGIFQYWNNERQCLMFNGYIDQLNDGYTDDTRPDGAKVAWSMYEWIWSSRTKQWIKQND